MKNLDKITYYTFLICFLQLKIVTVAAIEETSPPEIRFADNDSKSLPDFQKHIVPLLGKLGCSSAKCHGSFQGAGDFRLSLFGFDFQRDHAALTGEASSKDGNRINLTAPDRSLILLKPTKQIMSAMATTKAKAISNLKLERMPFSEGHQERPPLFQAKLIKVC